MKTIKGQVLPIDDQVWDHVRGQAYDQVRVQVDVQVWDQVKGQLWDQVYYQVYHHVFEELS